MRISDLPHLPAPVSKPRAQTPEEAAKQFEEVFVKEFVRTMTSGLFDSKLTGDEGPGWIGAYGDMQRDALTDELSKHLIRSGTIGISELMLRQWRQTGQVPPDEASPAPDPAP